MKAISIRNKKFKTAKFEDNFWGYAFIAVPFIIFCLFTIYPVISAFGISLQDYNPIRSEWVGFDNYKALAHDTLFFKSIKNTLIYTVSTVPVNLIIAFVLAVLIVPFSSSIQTVYKAMYYLPSVASGVSLSVVWLWIYSALPSGLLNQLVIALGGEAVNWLGQSSTSMFSLVLMSWLSSHGANVIIYIAALLGIPSDFYEEADLEGATFLQKLRYIVIPSVKPTTLFLLVTGIIKSFQVFMNAYMMTGGGPNNNTTMVGLLIFNNAFKYSEFGTACAQAIILAIGIAIISLLQMKFFGNDVEY